MTADEHNRTLATLYLIYGAMHGLTLIGLLLLIFAVRVAAPAAAAVTTFWWIAGAAVFLLLFLIVGLLPLVVWHGFRKRTRWVKPSAQALAVVSLINIPIGTALGIYTLKFFRTAGAVEIYGGDKSTASEAELQDALKSARPLMNMADRFKQSE
jgi:hypothetical protein